MQLLGQLTQPGTWAWMMQQQQLLQQLLCPSLQPLLPLLPSATSALSKMLVTCH